MPKMFRTLSIPQALVLLGLIAGVVAMWALTPAKLVDKLAEQSPETLAAGIVTIGIAVAGVFAQFRKAGPLLALLGVLALGGTLTGCGASPLRQHANAASTAMATMTSAGVAILGAERAALAACPDADGEARAACIDRVEHAVTAAAASRDALIPFVHGYRDAVQDAGENAEPSPTLLGVLETIAVRVFREIDVMREAIEALVALAQGGA